MHRTGSENVIRLATIEDARRIAEIHVNSSNVAYRGIVPDDSLDRFDVDQREALWRELCAREEDAVFVSCWDSGIVGFCHITASRDDDTKAAAEICSIYLDPAHQRKGIGRELTSAAIDFAAKHGFEMITLRVLRKNVVARRFYEAMNFRPDGARKTGQPPGSCLNQIRYRRVLPRGGSSLTRE